MKLKRREFLKQSALGVGSVLLASNMAAAENKCFDPYEKVTLGKTKLSPTRFCLGTGMTGGNRQSNHTRMGAEKFNALVRGAYERGARCFDMADLYGTHPYFAEAAKDFPRDSYTIFTKIWWAQPWGLPEPERPGAKTVIARFLKELKTDYVDLVLLHCVSKPNWNEDLKQYMDDLSELKSKGLVRALGVSCHSLAALETAANEPWVESVHARINPYGQSMDGAPEKVVPLLKKIHDAGKGVVGMKIIGEGRFRNNDEKKDSSVSYALNLGCVDVLNVGCENVGEVDDLAARVRKVQKPA